MIYQLKIELRDSDPKIWRRIQVPGDTVFSDLHDMIQLTMGWNGDHLYEFAFKDIRVYDFYDGVDDGSNPSERDSMDTFLDELVTMSKTRFTYVYDFGDHWEHLIQVEKILPEEKGKAYPVCIDGERACPPEDSGGIWGYQEKLRILSDKDDPQFNDIAEWMGEDWDAEIFDIKRTNALLQDYAAQWEEIYEETGEIMDDLERNRLEHEDLDQDPDDANDDSEYHAAKKFSCPADLLLDDYEHSHMKLWLETSLGEPQSLEYQTSERLRTLGFDEDKRHELILEALSIEWYYDLKYGTDHLDERYAFNLHHLPKTPLELPRLEDALAVLDHCEKGVPFAAIEYLQNSTSDEAVSAIIKALRNHSDHQYCWDDCTLAPFWYALAAEGHLREELIDPVIQLYEENFHDSDWLFDQGQYLIGKLAQKYPDLAAQKVLEAMEKDAEKRTKPYIIYLFDAFYFCDSDRYKSRLLALLERDDLSWHDMLAGTIADLQITEGLPILKRQLKKLEPDATGNTWVQSSIVEIKEAIQILQGELIDNPDSAKPLSLTRNPSWKTQLQENEHHFYEDEGDTDDVSYPDVDPGPGELFKWPSLTVSKPIIKEKTPGRNDPCPCGSGKKYKKCCIDKE